MENNNKEDIFDKLFHLPLFRLFETLYKKHKETLLYLLFGVLAFFLNILLFMGIEKIFNINELINNIICWIICVLFQFFTNRTWVFNAHVEGRSSFIKQMIDFFSGRFVTLVIEEIILAVFITYLGFHAMLIKILAQIVVILLNYIISKKFVFNKN